MAAIAAGGPDDAHPRPQGPSCWRPPGCSPASTPTGLERIAAVAVQVEFPADHVIARQGEIGTGFFVVVDGAVRVVRDGETIATLGPGDFFGELSVLDGQPRIA